MEIIKGNMTEYFNYSIIKKLFNIFFSSALEIIQQMQINKRPGEFYQSSFLS